MNCGKSVSLFFILFFLLFKTGVVVAQAYKNPAVHHTYSVSIWPSINKVSTGNVPPAHTIKGNIQRNYDAISPIEPPNISYQTPQTYAVNTPIIPLVPTNTGSGIGADVYGTVSVFAGSGLSGAQNGPAATSSFNNIAGVGYDELENLYLADRSNNTIREISQAGVVSTFAGSGTRGAADGWGNTASFFEPDGLVVGNFGTVFVSDRGNNLIRVIDIAGNVTTLAGSGAAGALNGLGTAASFNKPAGLAIDAAGNLYVADEGNNLIRKITPAGVVTTFAGSGTAAFSDGTGTLASFNAPTGVGADVDGNVYVADAGNNAIRKITPSGVVTTVAGNGKNGSADGISSAATFNSPGEVRADGTGNVYVTDTNNNLLRRIDAAGVVTTIAGHGQPGLNNPIGLTLDHGGDLYIGDAGDNVIMKVEISGYTIDKPLPPGLSFDPTTGIVSGTPTAASQATDYTITAYNARGSYSTILNIAVNNNSTPVITPPKISYQTPQTYTINNSIAALSPINTGGAVPPGIYDQVTTFAGGRAPVTFDATGTGAGFNLPSGIASDGAGNLYVSDFGSGAIRFITAAAVVTTIANINIDTPSGLTVDSNGDVFVTSFQDNVIYKITPNGAESVFVGSGVANSVDGKTTNAGFNSPGGITIDAAGNLYVADQQGNKIRKITPAGVVTTMAGSGAAGANNGTNNASTFNNPDGVAVDAQGNIYVADTKNNLIRKIAAGGGVTTLAGSGTAGSTDGTGTAASFNYPTGLTIDAAGNLYVADYKNNDIRKITAQGVVTTVAGSVTAGNLNGIGTAASFNAPLGLVADASGNVYITDAGNYLVRELALTGYTIDKPLPAGLTFDPATGIISGTPTVLSPPTDYTVTAYNAGGSSSTVVNIQVAAYGLKPSIITFPPPTPQFDQNNNLNPGASSTNNETTITYTSSDTSVAIILPNGLIHAIAPGVTTITAYQNGNSNYSQAAPVSEILTIVESQVIDFPAFTTAHTCDADFAAGAESSNLLLPLSYSSSNPSVATISNQGLIHIIGAGTTTITVSQDGNNLYSPANPQAQALTVTSPTALVVSIKPDVASICPVMPVHFIATVSGGAISPTYQWQLNGVNVGGNSNNITLLNLNLNDQLNCTVTNGGSCPVSGSTILAIIVVPYSTPSVSIQSDQPGRVCSGTNISFTATPANGGTSPAYQWQVNGVNAGTNNPVFASNAFADGDVVTCLLTNNDTPCLTTSTITSNSVKVSLYPVSTLVPSVTVSPQSFGSCVDLSVTYTATAKNAGANPTYQWQVNGQNAGTNDSTFTTSSLNTGDKITCTITSSVQCYMNTATSNVATIDADPLYYYSAAIKSSVTNNIATPGQQVTFTATVSDTTDVIYQWRVNDIVVGANSAVFTTSNLVNGDKVDCLVAIGGKCLATPFVTSNTIAMIVYTPVIIPNTFTPNGDGINDNWDMPSLAAYPGCTVSVFTRYGALIYNSTGYPKAWDGNYNGKELPTGTYYYVIDLKKIGSQPLSGFVAIVR